MGFVDVRVGWGLQLGGGGACNCERVCLQLRGDEYLWPHRCVYVLSRAFSLTTSVEALPALALPPCLAEAGE